MLSPIIDQVAAQHAELKVGRILPQKGQSS